MCQKHIFKTSWVNETFDFFTTNCVWPDDSYLICKLFLTSKTQPNNLIRQLPNTKGNSQKTFHTKSYSIRALPIRRTNRQITAKANYMKTDKRYVNIIQTN